MALAENMDILLGNRCEVCFPSYAVTSKMGSFHLMLFLCFRTSADHVEASPCLKV